MDIIYGALENCSIIIRQYNACGEFYFINEIAFAKYKPDRRDIPMLYAGFKSGILTVSKTNNEK